MRVLFTLLAVLALAVSPVAAVAAKADCDQDSLSMMAGSAHVDAQQTSGDPCCDHDGQGGPNDKTCAQICAAAGSVAVAPAISTADVIFAPTQAPLAPALSVPRRPFEPSALRRPPKAMV